MSYWHPDPDYPGWYGRYPLSDGQFLFLAALDYDGGEVYQVELQVADEDYGFTEPMDDVEWLNYQVKEGTPVGPGGTEVWGLLSGMLFHLEYLIAKQGGNPIFRASGATKELHRIYEHFLTRRGYISVAGLLVKELHWNDTDQQMEA